MSGHSWTPEEILSTFAHAPYFPPGTAYHYSNTNFILLGLIVQQITGQPLGDVYRQQFFAPLGMADTYFEGSGPPPPTAAAGYLLAASGLKEQTDGTDYRPTISGATVAWAAGAIDGSAHDLTVCGVTRCTAATSSSRPTSHRWRTGPITRRPSTKHTALARAAG